MIFLAQRNLYNLRFGSEFSCVSCQITVSAVPRLACCPNKELLDTNYFDTFLYTVYSCSCTCVFIEMFTKSLIALLISAAVVGSQASDCHGDQKALDECYMQIALDFAKVHNPKFPFGALVVDHSVNKISCYGANSNKKNKLLHGETAAFWK